MSATAAKMKVIRRMVEVVEVEVEPPPDLITQAEACKTYGLDRRRLSAAVGNRIPAYVVPDRKVKRGLPGPLVSRADIEAWMKPIIL